MRTIKFRAWGKNGKMYDRVLAGPGDPCSIVWDDDRKDWVHFDEVSGVIMQFTGMYDKNGVEIYEGDIIQTGRYPLREEDGYYGVIEYEHDRFWCVYTKKPDSNINGISNGNAEGLWEFADDAIEVIGNIYETKASE